MQSFLKKKDVISSDEGVIMNKKILIFSSRQWIFRILKNNRGRKNEKKEAKNKQTDYVYSWLGSSFDIGCGVYRLG